MTPAGPRQPAVRSGMPVKAVKRSRQHHREVFDDCQPARRECQRAVDRSSGGTSEQHHGVATDSASQLEPGGYHPGTVGQQGANSTFKAAMTTRERVAQRSAQPPHGQRFPSDHPVARPTRKADHGSGHGLRQGCRRDRWERFNPEQPGDSRPCRKNQEACRRCSNTKASPKPTTMVAMRGVSCGIPDSVWFQSRRCLQAMPLHPATK